MKFLDAAASENNLPLVMHNMATGETTSIFPGDVGFGTHANILDHELNQILQPLDAENPDDPLVLYHAVTGRQFTCRVYHRLHHLLSESLFKSNFNPHLMIDWTHCLIHPLIFKIDVQHLSDDKTDVNTYDTLIRYFEDVFIQRLQDYLKFQSKKMLLSMRRLQTGGMRVHLYDVELAHDDYVYLCQRMRPRCEYRNKTLAITLDCPSSMPLVACDDQPNPQGGQYVPTVLVHVQRSHQIYYCRLDDDVRSDAPVEHEFFLYDPLDPWYRRHSQFFMKDRDVRLIHVVRWYMSPAPREWKFVQYYKFPTRLVHGKGGLVDFTYCPNNWPYSLTKDGQQLRLTTSPSAWCEGSFCHRFFKHKSNFLKNVQFRGSNESVLKTWYDRYVSRGHDDENEAKGLFHAIDEQLIEQCPHLRPSPLRAILSAPDRMLPAYYALCNVMEGVDAKTVAEEVYRLAAAPPAPAGADSPSQTGQPPLPIPSEAAPPTLTFRTLEYLGFKTNDFLANMEQGWDVLLEIFENLWELDHMVRLFQKRFFPVVKEGEQLYVWDPIRNKWCKADVEELETVIKFVCFIIGRFKGLYGVPFGVRESFFKDDRLKRIVEQQMVMQAESVVGTREKEDGLNVPEYYYFEDA